MTFLISNVLHSQRGNPSSCVWTQYSTPWSAPAHPSMPFSPHGFFWFASSGLSWADLLNLTSKKASSRKSWINPFRISPWALPSQLSYIAIGLHYSAFSTLLWQVKERWKSDSTKVGLEHRKEPESLSLPESPSFMNSPSTSVVLNLQGPRSLSKPLIKAGAPLRNIFTNRHAKCHLWVSGSLWTSHGSSIGPRSRVTNNHPSSWNDLCDTDLRIILWKHLAYHWLISKVLLGPSPDPTPFRWAHSCPRLPLLSLASLVEQTRVTKALCRNTHLSPLSGAPDGQCSHMPPEVHPQTKHAESLM